MLPFFSALYIKETSCTREHSSMLDALAELVNKLTSKQVDGLTGKFAKLEGTPAANIRPDV